MSMPYADELNYSSRGIQFYKLKYVEDKEK